MRLRTTLSALMLLAALLATAQKPLYKNAKAPIHDRVEDLLSRMTLSEKIGQLQCPFGWPMYERQGQRAVPNDRFRQRMQEQPVGTMWGLMRADPWTQKTLQNGLDPVRAAELTNAMQRYAVEQTRLGIPLFFAEECAHGHMAIGTTTFPTGMAQAATWDAPLLRTMGRAIANEALAQGAQIGYGPVVDISRDARWSRVEENYGEDPYLSGALATAIVEGTQSAGDGHSFISTLKHFAAYGIPEAGLNGERANIGWRQLLTDYAAPFRNPIAAGAGSLMTSYNSIDGIPCTANRALIEDLARRDWQFQGVVFSDLHSIEGIANRHHCAADYAEAAAQALLAGVDIDLEGGAYAHLPEAISRGLCTEADVDRAVRRVLSMKFRLGLFEHPYVDPKAARHVHNTANVDLARTVARESITLLKNDGTLPFSKQCRRVAVIGPNADALYNQLGDYTSPQPREKVATVLDGVRALLPKAEVVYVRGCAIRDTAQTDLDAAVRAARASDAVILVVGGSSARDFKTDYADTGAAQASADGLSDMDCGEGFDRMTLDLLGHQTQLIEALAATGRPLAVVYIEGRPLLKNTADRLAGAVLTAWYPGEQGGTAIAEVLFGDYNPAGRLPVTVPRHVGQLPIYYSRPTAHAYVEGPSTPLYAFGHGLSYTTFAYSDLTVQPTSGTTARHDDPNLAIEVSFTVTNTGARDGDEVPQLYLCDEVASVETPRQQLRGFTRLHLKAGESQRVAFTLRPADLVIIDRHLRPTVEPGRFTLMIGAASNDIRLRSTFTVE